LIRAGCRFHTVDEAETQDESKNNMSDPISDMLTRIRNAGAAQLPVVKLPHSRIKESVANLLKSQGYVADVSVDGEVKKTIKINLKYNGKKSVIEGLKRVSKPGLRRYVGSTEIPRVRGGLGVAIVSTSEGLLTDQQARKKNLGGELLCYIW
jgi:small subunit ribosomal protein S8